jgi:hypothetical protein
MEPFIFGNAGRAWKLEFAKNTYCIAAYLVEAKWAHPLWSMYLVSCVHLRAEPPLPPPHIYVPGATHEFVVQAVDPDWKLKNLTTVPRTLSPVNFAGQLICNDDEEADRRTELAVTEIVEGNLNPDTDAIRQWINRFGDDMIKKEHRPA